MGRKHVVLEDYLSRVPELYRKNIVLLDTFKGNRTMISFVFSCGCNIEQCLKSFLIRDTFEFCTKCKPKKQYEIIYTCAYCNDEFVQIDVFKKHKLECENTYLNLKEGEDYVVCSICGFHAKSLGCHVLTQHNILAAEYKKNNKIICDKSSEIYSEINKSNGNWIERAKERGDDLSEYSNKMGNAVRESILSNPEDRKRRADVMGAVNRSNVMRQKSSDTAKITSARPDIQAKRAENMKRWRDENPSEFYNKCIHKMLNAWHSEPEKLLFELVSNRKDYSFKLNQTVKSNKFISKSKRKQVDIGDKLRRVYLEFDGELHFKNTKLNQLENVQMKDKLLDEHIKEHAWVLIRVGYDQFSYRKSDYGFKKECLERLFGILDSPTPGVHYLGAVYGKI